MNDQPTPAAAGFAARALSGWWPLASVIALAAVLRLTQIDQSLYGDEIWSYIGSSQSDPGAVIDWVRSEQEVTPPLYSLLAWASVQLGDPATLVRLPAMVSGIATIPLIYALAVRCFDRRVALFAALLAALSPFLIWHSVEARAYAVMIALTLGSTLVLLLAIERRRWWAWAAYGALSCAVMFSHYTGAFALLAQLAWCLWYHPAARLPALAANVGAALAFAVWIPGVLDDFDSSTQAAYNFLVPFSINDSLVFTKRLFGNPLTGFEAFLGTAGVGALLFGFAVAVAGTAIGLRRRFESAAKAPRVRPEVVLIGALAIAGPVGCVLGSISGTNMYLPRNFSASLPAILIALSALSLAGPIVYRAASIGLLLIGFAIGTVRIVSDAWQRPASRLATAFVDSRAEPGDLVIEATPFPVGVGVESPDGPLVSSLSVHYEQPHQRVDFSKLSDEVKQRLASGGYGHDVFLIGDGQTLAAVREQLGLPAPAPEDIERFDGVFELTVEQVPVPATPPAAE